MGEALKESAAPVPVLRDIVEIRIGPAGERVAVPLDLAQLTDRIADDLVPHLRRLLQPQLDAGRDQALETTLAQVRREVERVLLAQLGNPDA
jgi:hypothetical protein